MLFGPELVDSVGRDRLAELPVVAVREYERGSVAVVTPHPYPEGPLTLATPNVRRPVTVGRLPDPPLRMDGENEAPTELLAALEVLDGWHPVESTGLEYVDREPLAAWCRERLREDAPRTRAGAVRTLEAFDEVTWADVDRLPAGDGGASLREEAPVVRAALLDSDLIVQRDSSAERWSTDALADDDPEVRRAATDRLADRGGHDAARAATLRARDDPSPRVRAAALDALTAMDEGVTPAELGTVARRCFERESSPRVLAAALAAAGAAPAVDVVLGGLDHDHPDVRAAGIAALRAVDSGTAVADGLGRLLGSLGDGDDGVALASAETLAGAVADGCRDAERRLRAASREAPEPAVRAGAVWALGEADGADADRLRTALADPAARVRATAVEAVEERPAVAARVAGGLAARLVASTDRRELGAVGRALRAGWSAADRFPLDPAGLEGLLGADTHPRGRAAAVALGGSPDGADRLRAVVDGAEGRRLGAALAGLGWCGGDDDRERLRAWLDAPDPFVRGGALRGFARLVGPPGRRGPPEALADAVRETLATHESPVVTRAVVRAAERVDLAHEVAATACDDALPAEHRVALLESLRVRTPRTFERYPADLYRVTDRSVFDALVAAYRPVVADDGRPPGGLPW
jgi:hypothetical protein